MVSCLRPVRADDERLLDVRRLRRAGDERAERVRPHVDALVGLVQIVRPAALRGRRSRRAAARNSAARGTDRPTVAIHTAPFSATPSAVSQTSASSAASACRITVRRDRATSTPSTNDSTDVAPSTRRATTRSDVARRRDRHVGAGRRRRGDECIAARASPCDSRAAGARASARATAGGRALRARRRGSRRARSAAATLIGRLRRCWRYQARKLCRGGDGQLARRVPTGRAASRASGAGRHPQSEPRHARRRRGTAAGDRTAAPTPSIATRFVRRNVARLDHVLPPAEELRVEVDLHRAHRGARAAQRRRERQRRVALEVEARA